MKYAAFIRGINVGGNGIVRMIELRKAFEKLGHTDVATYINSGNVIFESDDKPIDIRYKLEKELSREFNLNIRMVIRSKNELVKTLKNMPTEWTGAKDLRRYIAFVREPVTEDGVLKEIKPRKDVDSVKTGAGVLYLSTKLSGLTKSGFTKLAGTKIYKEITIRNYTTVLKVLDLMEK